MMTRMPLAEVRFFAIVIAIQQQAGGNLSEALGNLSGVLRDRKRLQAKVQGAVARRPRPRPPCSARCRSSSCSSSTSPRPTTSCRCWTTRFGKFLLACAARVDDASASS